MARVNQEEEEKLETLKAWWNRYGVVIVIVLAVMVATIGGSKVWDYYQRQQAQQAADLYALLKQVQAGGDLVKITDAAHLLTEGYGSSGYAARAALIVAKASVDAGDMKRAKDHLQWILDNAKEPEIIDLARLRLAGILVDEKNYAAALQQLNAKHNDAFKGLYADLKGDVLLATGKVEEARLSYEAAIEALSPMGNYHNIVQMKVDALSASALPETLPSPGATPAPDDAIQPDAATDAVETSEATEAMDAADAVDTIDGAAPSDAAVAEEAAMADEAAGETDAVEAELTHDAHTGGAQIQIDGVDDAAADADVSESTDTGLEDADVQADDDSDADAADETRNEAIE